MIAYFRRLFGGSGLAPHGYCLFWDPALIWTHAISDALIGVAYFSIPFAIGVLLMRRPDLRFRSVAWLFIIFIVACGLTHFMSIWTLWYPDYGAEALVKLATAAASVATAIALWPLLPRIIALPSPGQLEVANADLRLRIAERDTALAALAEQTATRERTEALLRQAQKMDAIGQLTAGIAHDFNNLLTVVMGNISRAQRLASADPAIRQSLGNAMSGAQSAAKLTDQLLAFARQQPLMPSTVDLNATIEQILALFDSTTDGSIKLETHLAPELWRVQVDGSQAENAILNLLMNARDAMREGGRLTIRTRNAAESGCAIIEVSDTGEGMNAATRERIFEPFFTTKTLGRGSGLGLSQVYGFVTQSKGRIEIDSNPGEGSTIRVALPRSDGEA